MTARKWRSPAMLLAILVVLALVSLGLGYGLWSETLRINGTVETGEVDAEWTLVGCFDIEDKLVGVTSGRIDTGDPHILHFLIENGYPSYIGDCQVEFTNTGTLPLLVEAIRFIPGAGLTNCTVDQDPLTGTFTAYCDQLTVTWANGLCVQLHPGRFLGSSVRAHVEQPAEESSEYTFSIEVLLVQWNESMCP